METNRTPYMLLFRNSGPETHAHLSPDERQGTHDSLERLV